MTATAPTTIRSTDPRMIPLRAAVPERNGRRTRSWNSISFGSVIRTSSGLVRPRAMPSHGSGETRWLDCPVRFLEGF